MTGVNSEQGKSQPLQLAGSNGSRSPWIIIFTGIVLLSAVLRLTGLNKGIWLDEYAAIDIISRPTLWVARDYDYPPAYFLLLDAWSVIGTGEAILRSLSVTLGLGTVILLMLWIRSSDTGGALIAGLIAATLPTFLRYSQEIQTYPLLLFGTVLSLYFAGRVASSERRGPDQLGLAGALALVVSTHLIGAMILTAVAFYLFLTIQDKQRLWSTRMMLTLGFPIAVFTFIYLVYLGIPEKTDWWIPIPDSKLIIEINKNLFGWEALMRLMTRPGWLSYQSARMVLSFTFLAILFCLLFGDWKKNWPLAATAAFFWLELLAFSLLVTPVYWYHVAQIGMISLCGFIGAQLATIRLEPLRR